jgi:hypothetical protein
MAKQRGGESKVGLVVTLVISLLLNLGLGIGVYLFWTADDSTVKKAQEATKQADSNGKDRDWYKFQANLFRSFIGLPPTGENLTKLGLDMTNFERGGGGLTGADAKEVTDVVRTALGELGGWNTAQNRPYKTYRDLLADARKQNEALASDNRKFKQDRDELERKLQESTQALKEAQDSFEKSLTKMRDDAERNRSDDRRSIKELSDKLDALSREKEQVSKQSDEREKKDRNEAKKKDQTIRDQRAVIAAKSADLEQARNTSTEAPRNMRTDWRIVRIDPTGKMPYINLGSADRVQPQLTFSVHGVGPDGRPFPQAKATIEVVRVLDDHLAQTRVTSIKDQSGDPILRGDVLYNPSWSPNVRKHVALAGIIDLTGNGQDNGAEFRRNLERQGIVVDSWLDPKDMTIQGPGITVRTDYLVLGDTPESASGRNREAEAKMSKAMSEMQQKAKENGVPIIGLNRYLEMIGYRLPARASGQP